MRREGAAQGGSLTFPEAANNLGTQADGAIVLAVRIYAYLRGEDDRLQRVLHFAVRVDVARQNLYKKKMKKRGRIRRRNGIVELPAAYLFALRVLPALPLIETRSPVLEHIRLGVLLTLTLAEATLRAYGGYHVRLQQIDLQILLERIRDHVLGAPGTAVVIGFQSAKREREGE